MRTLSAHYFITADGIVDSPHSWHFPYAGPEVQQIVDVATAGVDALLLGRHTYEEWAAFWPDQTDFPLADFINTTPKYVASTTLTSLDWARAELFAGDVVDAVRRLKEQPGGRIAINGSGTLLRSLLVAGLVDELHLLVHPIVVGSGKHLFQDGTQPVGLTLASQRVLDEGVLYLIYTPAVAARAA
jgi:dihydrofolate reductase